MVSPKTVSYLWCNGKMDTAARNLVKKFNEECLPIRKVASSLIVMI